MAKPKNKKKMTPLDYHEAEFKDAFNKHPNRNTRDAYKKNFRRFVKYCIAKYKTKNCEQCKPFIQEYVNYLCGKGLSASTIHTYIAPVCGYYDIPMSDVEKPIRRLIDNKRSRAREGKYDRPDQQYDNPDYSYVADFQKKVGIRRSELVKLKNNALKQDESGQWCVEVIKGKGGKHQLQRILPEDVEFVKSYFTTPGDSRLFAKEQFSEHMDYHHLRALQAQDAYRYYYDLTHNEDGSINNAAAYKLRGEIFKRWNSENLYTKKDEAKAKERLKEETDPAQIERLKKVVAGKPKFLDKKKLLEGTYKLRGSNRELAVRNHLPTEYDRLCVMAVSILHLSHWRLDTLCDYLLAV